MATRGKPKGPCACGCGRASLWRGYAAPCYQRARMAGTLVMREAKGCRCRGCDDPAYAKGMCHKHYRRAADRARWTMSE